MWMHKMTVAVHDYPSIAQIMNRKVQKAEFEAKNPEPLSRAWPYGLAVPFELTDLRGRIDAEKLG